MINKNRKPNISDITFKHATVTFQVLLINYSKTGFIITTKITLVLSQTDYRPLGGMWTELNNLPDDGSYGPGDYDDLQTSWGKLMRHLTVSPAFCSISPGELD